MSRFLFIAALSLTQLTTFAAADDVWLPRSSPESQGVSSNAIREFVEAANQQIDTLHSFLLVRHGHVVAEGWWKPEAADKPHVLHSLSKSFCSTAVGLAVAEGKLSIDDPVLKFFPDDVPEKPSDKLKQMRVRDLLTMSTGHETEPKFTADDSLTEDIAKFGQLYLQKGMWNRKQLVPASWVEQATSKQVSNGSDPARDWDQGYGFQFWRCRHGAYRGDGAFGQFCLVLPEQDAVITITADTKDMQAELNVVWDKLLPAFHAAALPPKADEEARLKAMLANLAVPENHIPNTLKLPGTR